MTTIRDEHFARLDIWFYTARKPCGCLEAAVIAHRADVDDVADWKERGLVVELTDEEVKFTGECPHRLLPVFRDWRRGQQVLPGFEELLDDKSDTPGGP